MTTHDEHCPRPYKGDCLKFSTDGTRLGVEIAHTMATDDEEEIIRSSDLGSMAWVAKNKLEGMDAEQAEWESEDGTAWQ